MKILIHILLILCTSQLVYGQKKDHDPQKWIDTIDKAYKKYLPYKLSCRIETSDMPLQLSIPDQIDYTIIQGKDFSYMNMIEKEELATTIGTLKVEHTTRKIYFSAYNTFKENDTQSGFFSEALKSIGAQVTLYDSVTVYKENKMLFLNYSNGGIKSIDFKVDLKDMAIKEITQTIKIPASDYADMKVKLRVNSQENNIRLLNRYQIEYYGTVKNGEFIVNKKFSEYDVISY